MRFPNDRMNREESPEDFSTHGQCWPGISMSTLRCYKMATGLAFVVIYSLIFDRKGPAGWTSTECDIPVKETRTIFMNNTGDSQRRKENTIGIVVVSDTAAQRRMAPFLELHRKYAKRHGYDFMILNPRGEPACGDTIRDFFFAKHCAVRTHLAQKAPNYTMVVLDGDVLPVAPDVSLSRWLNRDQTMALADVVMYERSWNFEIMAGNYMVRNSPLGLHFLDTWISFHSRASLIKGFHSSDNGAIHLALLQVLGFAMNDYNHCNALYQALSTSSTNLSEYYEFVACTRAALGPNRLWTVRKNAIASIYPIGKVAILHRYHGFAIDAHIAGFRPGGAIPFYHGEKHAEEAIQHYFFNNSTRTSEVRPYTSAEEQGKHLSGGENWIVGAFDSVARVVPRVNVTNCVRTFSCVLAPIDDTTRHQLSTHVFRKLQGNKQENPIFLYDSIY